MTCLGLIPNLARLVRKKRQRKTGGSKNVYILEMSSKHFTNYREEIIKLMKTYDVEYYSPNGFLFKKRADAEKAWFWFMLRWS